MASGSRGDVEPYIALGRGFTEAGHADAIPFSWLFPKMVVTDQEIGQRAARLGEAIRAEDGVAAAAAVVGQIRRPGAA